MRTHVKIFDLKNTGDALGAYYTSYDVDVSPSFTRVFKIIYTFDKETGKIVESEPIYAKIIPAQAESFTFENEQL